jgi:hypothetical protein
MKILHSLVSFVLVVAIVTTPMFAFNKKQLTKLQQEQHKAMHEIIMVDRDENGVILGGGLCTAYAVGPHTLLTAEHCNDASTDQIYVDPTDKDAVRNNTAPYLTVVSRTFDKQDHMLLDLKGANFKYTIYLGPSEAGQPRLPKQGEKTYQWGNPQGIRDQFREGLVMGSIPISDLKDMDGVDATGPLYLVQEVVIGGDSGSSVFSQDDGQLIGIVTFGIDDGVVMGTFPIQFTGAQIAASMK